MTTDRVGEEVPLCFVCFNITVNLSMKLSKLLRHIETHHVFLNDVWISCQTTFPELAAKAMRCLLPFQTNYLCESVFSTLAYLKNKHKARLEPENDMTLSLSTISPRIDRLCGLHHAQILQ